MKGDLTCTTTFGLHVTYTVDGMVVHQINMDGDEMRKLIENQNKRTITHQVLGDFKKAMNEMLVELRPLAASWSLYDHVLHGYTEALDKLEDRIEEHTHSSWREET